jgi:hypothetical protein
MIESRTGTAPVPAEWDSMPKHPAFEAAVAALVSGLLDLCNTDPRMAAVCKDAGRYVVAMAAMLLHTTGGMTMPMLKRISADTGILSPGRTRGVVDFLIHIGYLVPDETVDGQPCYRPTADFRRAWYRQLQVLITAAAIIDPEVARLAPMLADRSDAFDRLVLIKASRLHALSQQYAPSPALQRAFLHPYAGSPILYVLTSIPVDQPATICISDLASRFEVTQIHVRRLLKRADEEGFLVYQGHGRLTRTRVGQAIIDQHYGMQLSEFATAARQTLAELSSHE